MHPRYRVKHPLIPPPSLIPHTSSGALKANDPYHLDTTEGWEFLEVQY